jgi:hypothetical protein
MSRFFSMILSHRVNACRRRCVVATAALVAAVSATAVPPPIYPSPSNLATNAAVTTRLQWTLAEHELIVNGGFETGDFIGWTRQNVRSISGQTYVLDTFINNGTYDPFTPDGPMPVLAGRYSAIMDEQGPGLEAIFQDVSIPAAAASVRLQWADQIRNHHTEFVNATPGQGQQFRVELLTTNNASLRILYNTEPGDSPTNMWTKRSADLTAYRGQWVRIAFYTDENFFFFNTHLDNISVLVDYTGVTTYDVYFGTNSVPSASFLGSTTNTSWDLPPLRAGTTYYWQVATRQGTEQVKGPVWRFATAPVGSLDHFRWTVPASAQVPGQPFAVTLRAEDSANNAVTNLNGNVALAGVLGPTNALSLLNAAGPMAFAAFDRSTVGYAFTPASDLLVKSLRSYSTGKVSLWDSNGVLLATEFISGAPNAWNEKALLTPLQVFAGRQYRIGFYNGGVSTNYTRFDGKNGLAHAAIVQGYHSAGDSFPTNMHPARWWLVDIGYSLLSSNLTVTPSVATLANGIWSGNVTVSTPAEQLVLQAASGDRAGASAPVTVR